MPAIQYTEAKELQTVAVGEKHLVTTINSMWLIINYLKEEHANAGKYVLILDEFHSTVSAVYGSNTLDHQRKVLLSDLQWLVCHCNKVIIMDNCISNADIFLIDSFLSETQQAPPLRFYVNAFKAFEGVPFSICNNRDSILEKMKQDILSKKGCVSSYNTKTGCRLAFNKMQESIEDPVLKARMCYYDGDTDRKINIALECDENWEGTSVHHNTKITTALDYHPTQPINSYNTTNGMSTVDPATALQMSLRNRNIKHLFVCPYNIPTEARFTDKEAFFEQLDFWFQGYNRVVDTSLDSLFQHGTPVLTALRELNNVSWSPQLRRHVYSENKFSRGYKE